MLNKEEKRNKRVILFGIILVILGFVLISSNYLLSKRQNAYEEISLLLSDIPEVIEEDIPETPILPTEEQIPINDEQQQVTNYTYNTETTNDFTLSKSYYIGKLIIPKIDLAKGFAAMNTSQNNVDKNIMIISPSDYPNVINGNLIIAGHSGNYWGSYFRDLEKLVVGDEAKVFYKNVVYTYKLVNMYNEPRGSKLKIYRNVNKTTMTLITCSMIDKKSQTILIFER